MTAPNPFDFSRAVVHDGYAWWYVDALADDGVHGLTIIAFVGSVFSPRYMSARRRAPTSPDEHCALNVVLYGGRQQRWVMTEFARAHVQRSATQFTLGTNDLHWDGQRLRISIHDRSAPRRQAVRGLVTVEPQPLVNCQFALDRAGHHRWQPLAPSARVKVEMDAPEIRWQGRAYVDSNHGDAPLARDFHDWDWCRGHHEAGTDMLYDVHTRDGERRGLALSFDAQGQCAEHTPPARVVLPTSHLWRMRRGTQSQNGQARVVQTLEDTPFYVRSVIETRLRDRTVRAVHESLSVDRFVQPWVQTLLPFRMRYQGA